MTRHAIRTTLLATIGLAAMASAQAADIVPGPPMMPPRAPAFVPFFSWSGFYAGVNFGYGWGDSEWTDIFGFTTGTFDLAGGLAGGTLGYNFQAGSAVIGIETDFAWSGIKGDTAVACLPSCETSLNWFGTVRGRLGYAFDRFLPYVAGGMAYGAVKASQAPNETSATQIGWTAGGGLEYAFVNNWTARVEYLYVDLGSLTCDLACGVVIPLDVSFKANIVRGGFNYKF